MLLHLYINTPVDRGSLLPGTHEFYHTTRHGGTRWLVEKTTGLGASAKYLLARRLRPEVRANNPEHLEAMIHGYGH